MWECENMKMRKCENMEGLSRLIMTSNRKVRKDITQRSQKKM